MIVFPLSYPAVTPWSGNKKSFPVREGFDHAYIMAVQVPLIFQKLVLPELAPCLL
jgi:hypothetical protein